MSKVYIYGRSSIDFYKLKKKYQNKKSANYTNTFKNKSFLNMFWY